MRRRVLAQGILALPILAMGCAKPQTEATAYYVGARLPRPTRVLVYPFAVSANEVQLNQGVLARVERRVQDQPLTADQMAAARDAQAALGRALVQKLRAKGLPAEVADGPPPPYGETLVVQGQIVAVNEGNRAERTLIGLGAGASSVTADTQLFYVRGAGAPRFLESFQGDSNSGRAPGAAETMGIGAASGHIAAAAAGSAGMHVASEELRGSDADNAARLADALADRIAGFAGQQGWILLN